MDDKLVEHLMSKYRMSREAAQAYAERLSNKVLPSPIDNSLKYEANNAAFQRTVGPYIERAKRIAHFQDVDGRVQRGEQVAPEDMQFWNRVKAEEMKRIQRESHAMLAAKRLSGMVQPAASAIGNKLAGSQYDLDIGSAQVYQQPDPTRYAMMSPVQAFTESFRDNSVPPPPIDPVSGARVGSPDYNAYHDQAAAEFNALQPRDLEIGPITLDPDTEALRAWEDPAAAARRKANAWYWNSEAGKTRSAEIEDLKRRVAAKRAVRK